MELQQLTTFPFILSFIFFLLMLVKISKKSRSTHTSSPLPPGPFKLPIIGHLHHLLGHLPHHKLKDLATKYGPIMYLKLGEVPTVVISSPGAAEQVMRKHDLKFVDRPENAVINVVTYGYKDVVGAPYGDSWRQLRKICVLELLSAKKVQSFWSLREEEVSKLVEKILLVSGSQINLSKMIFTLMNDITARAAFGKTCKDKEAFMSVADYIMRMVAGFSFVDIFPSMKFLATINGTNSKIKMVHQTVNKILDEMIREHKENRMETLQGELVDEDLMDVLLRIQEAPELEKSITMENVKAVIFDMFIAGTDTTSTLVEWTMIELLRNPSVMEKTQEEVRQVFNGKMKIDQADIDKLNYLRLVIKESLRLHPPAVLLGPRECRERCEIDGYEIPKGSKILVNAWAMGRDPNNWKDPESFEPERFQDMSIDYKGNNFKYIPFGGGRRICPGITFGMANVELALALLLYHFDWKFANGIKPEELDMTEVISSVVRRKENLHVVPTVYIPA